MLHVSCIVERTAFLFVPQRDVRRNRALGSGSGTIDDDKFLFVPQRDVRRNRLLRWREPGNGPVDSVSIRPSAGRTSQR